MIRYQERTNVYTVVHDMISNMLCFCLLHHEMSCDHMKHTVVLSYSDDNSSTGHIQTLSKVLMKSLRVCDKEGSAVVFDRLCDCVTLTLQLVQERKPFLLKSICADMCGRSDEVEDGVHVLLSALHVHVCY